MSDLPSQRHLEPHFDWTLKAEGAQGYQLGRLTATSFIRDPRSILMRAARYKFAAKMLAGRQHVLEVGCGDASMSAIVGQEVRELTCSDVDPLMLAEATKSVSAWSNINVKSADVVMQGTRNTFDGIFLLDVLEHIPEHDEDSFLMSIGELLRPDGICVVGMPSLRSQDFTTRENQEGHVNCKSPSDFRCTLQRHFSIVCDFGMNDETLNTAFDPSRWYLLAVCAMYKPSEPDSARA